jgi:hypothetical protein
MAKKFTDSANDSQRSQVQVELLELLLEPDNSTYPWNTTELESEAYFADREQSWTLLDGSEEEMATQLHFFSQLEKIWSAIAPTANNSASPDIPRDPQNEL